MVKIVFFGTAEVSVPFLSALLEREQVVGVVTRPDRPAARGYKLHMPAVKALVLEKNIPVFQPERFTGQSVAEIRELGADIGIAVSYGRIIPESVFSALKYGCFNVHFSLLPLYRGAAPVQWAVINGDKETGVTTFWMEKTLDTGPVIVQRSLPIAPEDDAATLMKKLIALGVDAMNETVGRVRAGECAGRVQTGTPSLAPCLAKEDGNIDWSKPAGRIRDLLRGTKPWPGVYTAIRSGKYAGDRLKIILAVPAAECPEAVVNPAAKAGQIVAVVKNAGFVVACGQGCLLIEEVHPENKKPLSAWAFWQSGHLHVGDLLG